MSVVVFLGPSLPQAQAQQLLDAIYLPPARQSDLLSAVTIHRPQAIGLIDGLFGQSLSVWHKEILYALEQGIAVYGASSMGALRAVETEAFGMVGVGEVFRMYRDGELTDDDEVALAHADAEHDYRAISEPFVNVRETLALAVTRGVLTPAEHDLVLRAGKRLYFPERTLPQIVASASADGLSAAAGVALQEFWRSDYVDIKRADAVALLRRLARREWEQVPPTPFKMTHSHLFAAQFNRDRAVRYDEVDVPLAAIAAYASLNLADFPAIVSQALNRVLVGVLAELLNVEVDDGELQAERDQLCRHAGLSQGEEGLAQWGRAQRLEPFELAALVREQALMRKLQRWLVTRRYLERTTKLLLDELRLTGRFEACLAGAAEMEKLLAVHHPGLEQSEQVDASLPDLLRQHLRAADCTINTSLSEWLEMAGFKDTNDLRFELVRARLAREVLRETADEVASLLDAAESR